MNEITYPPGCKDIQVELANDELIRRLKKIQQTFQNFTKDPSLDKYKELSILLGSDVFIDHEHDDVKLLVACCVADVIRLYAPDLPYHDPSNLKKIFLFLASQLKGLRDKSKTAYNRYHYLLENLRQDNKFLLCLELEDSQDIIAEVFDVAFKIINDRTDANVRVELFELLLPLLNESDHLSSRVLDTLFARIIEPQKSNNKEAYNLASNLIKKGNENFEFLVQNHLNNILLTSRGNLSITNHAQSGSNLNASVSSEDSFNSSLNADKPGGNTVHGTSAQFISDKLCLIIYELQNIRYALLELVLPQLEYKLKSSDLKERREYTKLLSKMFSEKDSILAQKVPNLWEAYLERFADANEDIRKICIQHICDFLIQQSNSIKSISSTQLSLSIDTTTLSSTANTHSNSSVLDQIIEIIKNRSLDSEESLRFEVVQEILKAIKQDSNLITLEILNVLKDRTLDVKIKVRKMALQGLAALYKKIHSKTNISRTTVQVINWIPTKIMRIYFQESVDDKLLVERLLNSSIVPYSFGAKEKMAQLYYAYTTFDEYSILSLIEIMKNRVFLNSIMKSMIEKIESNPKIDVNSPNFNEVMLISQHLLDTSKGHDFMKTFLNLLKTNHNVRNFFKNLVNVNNSCSKSLQLIQMILTNLNTLNQTQLSMAKRLIERMSSIVIDKECIEKLIELIEIKVRQRLTLKQRKLMSKKKQKSEKVASKPVRGRARKARKDESSEDEDDSENEDEESEEEENDETMDSMEIDEEAGEDDDIATKSSENSNPHSDRLLIRHVDDDGEKGIKLLNLLLMIHNNYGFNNSNTYKKLFSFVNCRKDNVASSTLKLLSAYYSTISRPKDESEAFNRINDEHLDKLKNLCKFGKPKQAKHAVNLIFKNFESPQNEEILYEIYKDLLQEAEEKNGKTFITSLISLGHICFLIPKKVGKEIKEFISKNIVKEILMQPLNTQLNISFNESSNSLATKRKNNLKLAGKWCENEEELPIPTRARIEAIKLVSRWCLGLKAECTNIIITLKILFKLIRENVSDTSVNKQQQSSDDSTEEVKNKVVVSEAEKSRIRAVCGSQIIKLAQEPCFKQLITAEYFHILAKLMIDPVNNVRDIIIKKLTKPLKASKLPPYYMGIFALCGLDTNKERKMKVKKIYASLIKQYRQTDSKDQKNLPGQKGKILPEMCLSYAVSLLAHNIKIDSLKDDHKVKQIKECMSLILDPLLENPDSYQIALIKKILNKIKVSDDGLASNAVNNQSTQSEKNSNKSAFQNLYIFNKSLVFICEIFLFHMHSKTTNYLTAKECQFDVNLPAGFYATRENGSDDQNKELNKEVEEHFKQTESTKLHDQIELDDSHKINDISEITKNPTTTKRVIANTTSRIEIVSLKRKAEEKPVESEKGEEEDSDDDNIVLSDLKKSKTSNRESLSPVKSDSKSLSPPASKKRLTDTNLSPEKTKTTKQDSEEENEDDDNLKTRRSSRRIRSSVKSPEVKQTTRGKKVTKKSSESEEEKENEIESDVEEEKVVKKTESKNSSKQVSEEENEESDNKDTKTDSKRPTRKSTRASNVTNKKSKTDEPSKPVSKKETPKNVVDSPSYSLRQKRASTAAKK